MTGLTISSLMILFLLLITCSRFLFIKKVKADSLSAVPIVAFLLSLLMQSAYGISVQSCVITALSFFVMIWNVRALLRLASKVVIDHYGFWFIFISSVNLLLTLAAVAGVIYFNPQKTDFNKYGVTVTETALSGSFDESFYKTTRPFSKITAHLWKFEKTPVYETTEIPLTKEAEAIPAAEETLLEEAVPAVDPADAPASKIILFMPPKTAVTETYLPFLAKLARDGYTVYTADFHDKEHRFLDNGFDSHIISHEYCLFMRLKSQTQLQNQLCASRTYLSGEYKALIALSEIKEDDFVFLVTEEDLADMLPSVKEDNPYLIDGCFDLSSVKDYTTRGYGPVENTSPLLAWYLGHKKDNTFYMASHLATELEKSFERTQKVDVEPVL